ncbi:MAG: Hsp20/alpha crystallin family protein [Nitrospirota bacterium]|nr:Hsp20/alpha crystallin family protein [Nitrospirota bacterium]
MGMLVVKRANGTKRPWDGFSLVDNEVNSFFDNFLRGFDVQPYNERRERSFVPKVDVSENEKEINVSAELPGMEEKDIEVSLEKDFLVIRGEKKEVSETKEKGVYHTERSYGAFTRTIQLPEGTDGDNIKARYKNGVLTVTVPKSQKPAEGKKKIDISAE